MTPVTLNDQKNIASVSYFAYQNKSNPSRSITFIWPGGPGASSLSSNFLESGPKKIDLENGGVYSNSNTWLTFTDLVYIDMPGTGWGRVKNEKDKSTVYSPKGDAHIFSQFIKNYLEKYGENYDQIFLAGESYGGYRAPLVAINLLKDFIEIKGIILQSPLLQPSYSFGSYDNIMAYALAIPTYIRTALYYQKLSPEFQKNPQGTISKGVEWALKDYLYALLRGNKLDPDQEATLASQLNKYTGLNLEVIKNHNYRIPMSTFRHTLLADQDITLDYTNATLQANQIESSDGMYIMHMKSVMTPLLEVYEPAIQYLHKTFDLDNFGEYVNYFDPSSVWHWDNNDPLPEQVISVLQDNLVVNDKLKLFIGVGYYDTDIPYMVTEMVISQLYPSHLKNKITLKHYEGGHMFAANKKIQKRFTQDIQNFIANPHLKHMSF